MSGSTSSSPGLRLVFAPRRVALVLAAGILLIVLANVAAGFRQLATGQQVPYHIDVARESNIPTWYSSLLMALAGGVAALAGRVERRREGGLTRYWQGLAALTLYISLDEVAQFHEILDYVIPGSVTEPFGQWITVHPWVLIGLPFALLVGLLYLPFLRALPTSTRNWLVLAGAVYVGGAIGGESLHGFINVHLGGGVFTSLAILVEETLEMAGAVILVYGTLDHLRRVEPGLALELP